MIPRVESKSSSYLVCDFEVVHKGLACLNGTLCATGGPIHVRRTAEPQAVHMHCEALFLAQHVPYRDTDAVICITVYCRAWDLTVNCEPAVRFSVVSALSALLSTLLCVKPEESMVRDLPYVTTRSTPSREANPCVTLNSTSTTLATTKFKSATARQSMTRSTPLYHSFDGICTHVKLLQLPQVDPSRWSAFVICRKPSTVPTSTTASVGSAGFPDLLLILELEH